MSLRSTFSGAMQGLLQRAAGRTIVHYHPRYVLSLQRPTLLQKYQINLVLDVGANIGQTGAEFREEGFRGRIVSFEPQSAAFKQLQSRASADGNWMCHHTAVGDRDGMTEINLSGFHASSSLLPMLDRHIEMVPNSGYVGKETVPIAKLDTLLPQIVRAGDRTLLKIDTQGYEVPVLFGAGNVLNSISLVHVELSLVPLYGGQAKYYDLMRWVDERGFDLVGVSPQFYEAKSGHFLQADAMFARRGDLRQ